MKKAFYILSALSVIALVLAFSLLSPAEGQEKTIVRNYGVGLLSDVVQTHREEFVRANPAPRLTILGPTTRIGDQKLVHHEAEPGMPTQRVASEEAKIAVAKGVPPTSTFAGNVCLAVATNAKNSVNEITVYHPAQVFQVTILNWSSVGGLNEHVTVTIQALSGTGVGVLIERGVLKGDPYARDAQIMSSCPTSVQGCGNTPAIGHVPTGTLVYYIPAERGIRMVAIGKAENAIPYDVTQGLHPQFLHPTRIDLIQEWTTKHENQVPKCFADLAATETQ